MVAQAPENVPINGYCGAPPDPTDAEAVKQFTCAEGTCCGKAIAAGAGEETAVYTCQKDGTSSYSPLKMEGYSQYDTSQDWVFQCPEVITGARAMLSGMIAMFMAILVYIA